MGGVTALRGTTLQMQVQPSVPFNFPESIVAVPVPKHVLGIACASGARQSQDHHIVRDTRNHVTVNIKKKSLFAVIAHL